MSAAARDRHESVMTLLWLGSVGQPPMIVTRSGDSLFANTNELVILDRNGNVITRFTEAAHAKLLVDAIVATFPAPVPT